MKNKNIQILEIAISWSLSVTLSQKLFEMEEIRQHTASGSQHNQ